MPLFWPFEQAKKRKRSLACLKHVWRQGKAATIKGMLFDVLATGQVLAFTTENLYLPVENKHQKQHTIRTLIYSYLRADLIREERKAVLLQPVQPSPSPTTKMILERKANPEFTNAHFRCFACLDLVFFQGCHEQRPFPSRCVLRTRLPGLLKFGNTE